MQIKNFLLAACATVLATAYPLKKRVAPNPGLAVDLPLYSWPIDGNWDEVYTALKNNPTTQFNIIISAQRVATCPPLNGASLLHRYVSSVTSWMCSSSIMAVKQIRNPSKMWHIPSSIPLPPSSAVLVV